MILILKHNSNLFPIATQYIFNSPKVNLLLCLILAGLLMLKSHLTFYIFQLFLYNLIELQYSNACVNDYVNYIGVTSSFGKSKGRYGWR